MCERLMWTIVLMKRVRLKNVVYRGGYIRKKKTVFLFSRNKSIIFHIKLQYSNVYSYFDQIVITIYECIIEK